MSGSTVGQCTFFLGSIIAKVCVKAPNKSDNCGEGRSDHVMLSYHLSYSCTECRGGGGRGRSTCQEAHAKNNLATLGGEFKLESAVSKRSYIHNVPLFGGHLKCKFLDIFE